MEEAAAAERQRAMNKDWSREVDAIVNHAKQQFSERAGWDGDVREGPCVAGQMPPEQLQEFTTERARASATSCKWKPVKKQW